MDSSITSYQHFHPLYTDLYCYLVKATDGSGQISSLSNIRCQGLNYPKLPDVVYFSTVNVDFSNNDEVQLNLYISDEDGIDIQGFNVERKYPGSPDFNTIGFLGMNEAILNFTGEDIGTEKGREFALEIMDFMRNKLSDFQEENKGSMYNLEATPAEGCNYRFAKLDKKQYPNIIQKGKDEPYYTNSSQLPVDHTDDMFFALQHQDELQCKYTGGTVMHLFLGERIDDKNMCKQLVKKIAEKYKMPYFSITPTFSICPVHGYLDGEHTTCPICSEKK